MSLELQILTVVAVIAGTVLTRSLPFLIFPAGKPVPPVVKYLGRVLPSAVFAMLVIYCLRHVNLFAGTRGIPEMAALAVTVGLHVWRRNMFLSMVAGTACYMLFVQKIFAA